MTQPQLLFVFGRHPGNNGGGDQKHFRNNIIPFVEGRMKAGGAVAIVHPACLVDHVPLARKQKDALATPGAINEAARAAGMGFVRDYLRTLGDFWASELGRNGTSAYSWTGHGMGYENELEARLRGAGHPGRLLHLIEPQSDIVAIMKWDMERRYGEWCAAPSDTRACKDYIKALTLYLISRDQLVQHMSEEIAGRHDGIAIVIPRERMHLPMVMLFDEKKYDIKLREWEHHASDGVFTATVINFYSGQIKEYELEDAAGRMLAETGPPSSAAAARI